MREKQAGRLDFSTEVICIIHTTPTNCDFIVIAAILTVTSNDRLRDILPYLRLRHGEPTLFSQTAWALLWIGLAVLVALYIRGRLQQRRRRRREFRDLGLDLGLNDGELRLAMSVAHRDHMKRPHLLLTSVSVFERHVGAYASHLASSDLHHPVLKRIRQLRTALGFDITAADRALTSSRQLEKGQMLMISAGGEEGHGQFSPWLLVDRDEGVIPVVPRLREDADYFDDLAPGDRLSVRLWREADTEYCFDTQLVARDRGTGTFLLRHSAKVERVQQRDFFRVEASFDIALFGMNDADSGGEGAIEGSGAERDSAAIVLLDTPEGEVASSPDQERDSSPLRGDPPPPSDQTAGVQDRKEHSVDIPDNAPRVDGRVSNNQCRWPGHDCDRCASRRRQVAGRPGLRRSIPFGGRDLSRYRRPSTG